MCFKMRLCNKRLRRNISRTNVRNKSLIFECTTLIQFLFWKPLKYVTTMQKCVSYRVIICTNWDIYCFCLYTLAFVVSSSLPLKNGFLISLCTQYDYYNSPFNTDSIQLALNNNALKSCFWKDGKIEEVKLSASVSIWA